MRRDTPDIFAPEIPALFGDDAAFDVFAPRQPQRAAVIGDDDVPPPVAIAYSDAIDPAQILRDRPDVLASYYTEINSALNDRHSNAWVKRVGGSTPEDYAAYWYKTHGEAEGYDPFRPSANIIADRVEILRAMNGTDADGRMTFDGLGLRQILAVRPDVLRGYYEGYYGPGNDRHSDAWIKRVGGDTPEDYANYWYEKYGRYEGYGAGSSVAAEQIDIDRLLIDRPDVLRGFYEQFYGHNNDRKSPAWVERVGGDTLQDYAKYWYVTYGRKEGYTQRPPQPEEPLPEEIPTEEQPPEGEEADIVTPAEPVPEGQAPIHDPNDDPWNHPEVFPDWSPPYEGWEPPQNTWHHVSEADFFG